MLVKNIWGGRNNMECKIKVNDLFFKFDESEKEILNNSSFEIEENSFVAFIGPNGIGKSTILNLLTSQINQYSGQILVNGEDIKHIKEEIFTKISILNDKIKTPRYLTVEEALKFSLKCYNQNVEEKYREILKLFSLEGHQKKQIRQLSSGLERRAELAQTLTSGSDIIILDEPCNALDFTSVKETIKNVMKIWKTGKTIIYTTHQFHEIEEVCTHVMVMKNQKIVLLPKSEIHMPLSEYYKNTYEVIKFD